jgi:hypothetical protein
MPLLAYFWRVGAALLALLFAADFCLPKAMVVRDDTIDRPTIRIHSDRKWPERLMLDTSQPVIIAAAPDIASVQASAFVDRAEPPVTRTETAAVADALAMARTDQLPREAVDRKRPRKTQRIAMRSKRHAPPQMLLAARQGQFPWFGYRYW